MKVAVIGGGIAGLMAAYLLDRRHQVWLFEAAPQLGGHTHTVRLDEAGRRLDIDMGFIVYNETTYPRFTRLLEVLGVASRPSSMSFSVRCEQSGLEYNGGGLNQLFAQRRNLLRPSHYRMLRDILRFHRLAPALLDGDPQQTLGDFLARHRLRGPVVDRYLVPMIASIWSAEPASMAAFPAQILARFLHNHGMLQVRHRPRWRVVEGGSQRYVEAWRQRFGGRVSTATPVRSIRRDDDGVRLRAPGLWTPRFDQVVIATHSDQALRLLAAPSAAERRVLGAIPYRDNEVVLHTDASFLPRRRRAWASWNYHLNPPRPAGVQLTYYMNSLQSLDARRHYCVTLNRGAEIDPRTILERRVFAHPVLSAAGVAAQGRWAEISGLRRTHYCGAYWRFGFHEDGVWSALRVAEALGAGWQPAARPAARREEVAA